MDAIGAGKMMIDQLRWVYRAWRYRLKVERQEIRWLLQNVHAGDCVVDIGAHKGAFTYWLRRRVGPRGKVFAFEPQPDLAARLERLVRARNFDNVVVANRGVSSRAGRLELAVPGRLNSPGASFESTEDTRQPGHKMTVEVTTLDRCFNGTEPFRIRLIKCDVEGHELEVFRGARRLLSRDHPDLLFECEARHLGGRNPSDVFAFLQHLGYRGHALDRGGLLDISEFDPGIHQSSPGDSGYINNFLFTAAGRARV